MASIQARGFTSFEAFAQKAIVTIVTATRPLNIEKNMFYRVNVNTKGGVRIGAATFNERGGGVEWQRGPSKTPFN